MEVEPKDLVMAAQVVGQTGSDRWVEIQRMVVPVVGGVAIDVSVLVIVEQKTEYINVQLVAGEVVTRTKQKIKEVIGKKRGNLDTLFPEVEKLLDEYLHQEYRLQVILGLVTAQVGLFATLGLGSSVSIVRQQKLGVLIQESGWAEGGLLPGDVVVLASDAFFRAVPFSYVEKVCGQNEVNVDRLAEELVTEAKFGEGVAVLLLKIPDIQVPLPSVSISWKQRLEQVRSQWFTRNHPDQVFVRTDPRFNSRQRLGGLIFTILFLVLAVSVSGGWWRRQQMAQREQYRIIVEPIEKLLTDARAQMVVNPRAARHWLADARKQLINYAGEFDVESDFGQQWKQLTIQVEQEYIALSGETPVQVELYLDLTLTKPGFYGQQMDLAGSSLWVLDPELPLLLKVGAKTKSAEVFAGGGDLAGVRLVSGSSQTAVVWGTNGIVRVEDSKAQRVVDTDPDWVAVTKIGQYGNNVYVLDKGQGEIWRYRDGGGQSTRQRWLAPSVKPDFSKVVDMVIDGDIWLLDSDGSVRQYQKGVSVGVKLEELDAPLQEPIALAVTDLIYILDRSGKRVVIFGRDGTYQKQLKWTQALTITDMVVVENQVLLLTGSSLSILRP